MTFANIALKNIRKKFGNYISYFFSTAFSVLIFSLFCSMYYNPTFAVYSFGTGKMNVLFRGAAIAVFLFSIVFVLYSGSYFIKNQKKEIAIYSLLGMRKGYIALMMFLETFIVGLLAIACGTIVGAFSAGYFTSVLMRFMAVGTSVTFSLDPRAIVITIVAFILLFVISGIKAYRTIYQYTLIDLLSASKQSEGIPSYSKLGAFASIVLLACGYVISMLVRVDVAASHMFWPVMGGAICILLGTFLLFRNFVPMAISFLKKRKLLYYKTSNFIGISQIAFRLKANSRMLSVITLLTAITITMVSASYSFYSVLDGDGTEAYAPFSYIAKGISQQQYDKILKTVSDISEVKITSQDKIELILVSVQNDQYAVKDQQTGEALVGKPAHGYLMSQSMYLKIISETDTPKGSFSETRSDFEGGLNDKTCYFIDGNAVSDYCKDLIGKDVNVSFNGKDISYSISGAGLHKYIGALDLYKYPTIVVSDDIYKSYYSQADTKGINTYYGFQFDDDMLSGRTVDAIDAFIPARFHIGGLPGNMSYIGVYKANFALFGSYAFIGFFLGSLFLLASGSVLYYKLIIEAQEEAPRYTILRKTGMKRTEIFSSISKQLGLVYGVPLFVGLIHTLFGLLLYNRALGVVGDQTPTLLSAAAVVMIYILGYCVFYVLSVLSYNNIVWKRANK